MIVRQNRFLETLSIYDNVLEDSGQTSPDLLETLPELQELLKTQSPRFQKLEYIVKASFKNECESSFFRIDEF